MAQIKIDPKDKKRRLAPVKKLMIKHETKLPFDAICMELEELRELVKKSQKTQKKPPPPKKPTTSAKPAES